MAHNLEIIDGKAQMFSGEGITPWHGMGTKIAGLATAEEALKHAGLDWEVQLIQATKEWKGEVVPIPGRFSVTRMTDGKDLGLVSDKYHPFQNLEAFHFLNGLTDTMGEAVFTTAGSLFGGSRTFVVLKLTNGFTVGDQDAHDLYLMCTNSHDGNQSFTISATPIRAVCWNTVTMGLAAAKTKWSIKHKMSLEGQLQNAREVLELGFRYEKAFEAQVKEMMEIQITKDKFQKIADIIIPASPIQHDISVEELMAIWENEPTVKMGGGEGNGWGAFNAATYWVDHKEYKTPESRFNSIIGGGVGMGLGEKIRPAAQKAIMQFA